MTTTYTKRGVIKQLVNRETVYRLSDYVRYVFKRTGRTYSTGNIVLSLRAMEREGQLVHTVVEGKVIGKLADWN